MSGTRSAIPEPMARPVLTPDDHLKLARAPRKASSAQSPIAPPTPREVFQRGADGKLHPVAGYRITGPFDFGAWAHNIDWGGVVRDIGKIGAGGLAGVAPGITAGAMGWGVSGAGATAVDIAGAGGGVYGTADAAFDELAPKKPLPHR